MENPIHVAMHTFLPAFIILPSTAFGLHAKHDFMHTGDEYRIWISLLLKLISSLSTDVLVRSYHVAMYLTQPKSNHHSFYRCLWDEFGILMHHDGEVEYLSLACAE